MSKQKDSVFKPVEFDWCTEDMVFHISSNVTSEARVKFNHPWLYVKSFEQKVNPTLSLGSKLSIPFRTITSIPSLTQPLGSMPVRIGRKLNSRVRQNTKPTNCLNGISNNNEFFHCNQNTHKSVHFKRVFTQPELVNNDTNSYSTHIFIRIRWICVS